MTDDYLLAYLAGALDSDGWFFLTGTPKGRSSGSTETIGLGQVTDTVPELLASRFGGTIYVRRGKGRGRDIYIWSVHNRRAVEAARELLPLLRLKHEQAAGLIAMRALKDSTKRRHLTDGDIAARDAVRERVNALNRTGRRG